MIAIRKFNEKPEQFSISTENDILLAVETRDDIEYVEDSNQWIASCYYLSSMSLKYSKHTVQSLLIRCRYSADEIFDISLLDDSDPRKIVYKQYVQGVLNFINTLP